MWWQLLWRCMMCGCIGHPQIMGTMMASFAEGLELAKQVGLDQQDLLDASGLGAIAAPMFALKVGHSHRRVHCPRHS